MKAEINGVKLEGTPAELAEYVRLVAEKKESKPLPSTAEWWKDYLKRVPGGDSSAIPPWQIQTYPSWQPNQGFSTTTSSDATTYLVFYTY